MLVFVKSRLYHCLLQHRIIRLIDLKKFDSLCKTFNKFVVFQSRSRKFNNKNKNYKLRNILGKIACNAKVDPILESIGHYYLMSYLPTIKGNHNQSFTGFKWHCMIIFFFDLFLIEWSEQLSLNYLLLWAFSADNCQNMLCDVT